MINPYVTEFPADPKYFAGRGKELGEIKEAIDHTIHSKPATPYLKNIWRDCFECCNCYNRCNICNK